MPEETPIAVVLGVGVGLRLSEVLGVNIEDLNVEACTYRPVIQYKPSRRVDEKIGTYHRPLETLCLGSSDRTPGSLCIF
jgi:integrase